MNAADIPPGTAARAETPLRPSGKVSVADATFDARAEGEWFDAGQPVSVLRVDGFGLVVGRPGTVSRPPMPDGLPRPTAPPAADDGPPVCSHALEGAMAFAALGTALGGLSLLLLVPTTPPTRLLRLIPRHLVGGAVLGLATFSLGLALGALRRRLRRGLPPGRRPRSREGP